MTKYLSLFPFQVKLTGGCTTEKGTGLLYALIDCFQCFKDTQSKQFTILFGNPEQLNLLFSMLQRYENRDNT